MLIVNEIGRNFSGSGMDPNITGTWSTPYNIGKRIARLCQGIGIKVMAYDIRYTREQIEEMGVQYAGQLDDLLNTSDVVTIHTPLTPLNTAMIGAAQLAIMKPEALLINCARGGIIDEAALLKALAEGAIAGAALDVLLEEPFQKDNPLLTAPNLIISPHSAAQKKEAVINMATMCANGCKAILNGQQWPYVANPEAYQHPRWQPHQ